MIQLLNAKRKKYWMLAWRIYNRGTWPKLGLIREGFPEEVIFNLCPNTYLDFTYGSGSQPWLYRMPWDLKKNKTKLTARTSPQSSDWNSLDWNLDVGIFFFLKLPRYRKVRELFGPGRGSKQRNHGSGEARLLEIQEAPTVFWTVLHPLRNLETLPTFPTLQQHVRHCNLS